MSVCWSELRPGLTITANSESAFKDLLLPFSTFPFLPPSMVNSDGVGKAKGSKSPGKNQLIWRNKCIQRWSGSHKESHIVKVRTQTN